MEIAFSRRLSPPDGGVAWQILTRHALGPVASPSEPVAIAQAIETLVSKRETEPNFDPPKAYHRRQLSSQLAALMDEITTFPNSP
jgi:hypothetical protein